MAFKVSKWPYSPDPRKPDFSALGWAFGAYAPWQWEVRTTGALGLYVALNDGVKVTSTIQLPEDTRWQSVVIPPHDLEVDMAIKGSNVPIGPVPQFTISIGMAILVPGELDVGAGVNILRPFALQVFTMGAAEQGGSPFADVPNPITITPLKWNV